MQWANSLPRFTAIVGVPRSGVIIASMLATYQNTHVISLNDLVWGVENWKQPLRRNCPGGDGPILVVDDTVATGGKMNEVKALCKDLPYPISFGAYLAMNQGKNLVDHYFEDVGNTDHLFQFNIFHHWFNQRTFTDLDGVLSEDWNHDHETGDLAETYANHLENSRCLFRPSFPLKAIVTGRLESHREVTEAWLAGHGIQYSQLIMFPAFKPENRHDVGLWKGMIYKQSDAILFVESCPHQSQRIREVSGRDVLDWSRQRLV